MVVNIKSVYAFLCHVAATVRHRTVAFLIIISHYDTKCTHTFQTCVRRPYIIYEVSVSTVSGDTAMYLIIRRMIVELNPLINGVTMSDYGLDQQTNGEMCKAKEMTKNIIYY